MIIQYTFIFVIVSKPTKPQTIQMNRMELSKERQSKTSEERQTNTSEKKMETEK